MIGRRLIPGVASLLALCLLGADAPRGRTVRVEWRYTITPAGETSRVNLTVLVPRTLDPRQRLKRIEFSHEPVERQSVGNNSYARFFFRDLRVPTVVRVTAEIEMFPDGLAAHRPREDAALDAAERERLTGAERFIESDSPEIRTLAVRVPADQDTIARLRAIWSIVADKLKRGPLDPADHGAVAALSKGEGDCTEFADLFVALCRASGIPAKWCSGYTVKAGLLGRTDPHHDWASVFIEERGWVRVDPSDAASRLARFETQSCWYIQLSDQRNDATLNAHGYKYTWRGAEPTVELQFEVLDR